MSHISTVITIVGKKGSSDISGAAIQCAGPCIAETTDLCSRANGKLTHTKGVNCYETDLQIGHTAILERTAEDTMSTKKSNTNVACMRYHFDNFMRHDSRDEHGSHSAVEVN